MARSPRTFALAADAITVEGALIAPAMLARVAAREAEGQSDAEYRIPKGLTLRDEIARYFRIGQALFAEINASNAPSVGKTITFTEALLRDVFGFTDITRVGSRAVDERLYAVTLEGLSGRAPIVVVPPSDNLDRASDHLPTDGRRRSAATALQDWLNAQEGALWGFCSNGERLRLLRDNASLTRPAYIEADLRQIFDAESFADFTILWLLIHASRFGAIGTPASDCALERWREAGGREGAAARERLRDGVEAALKALGTGFLTSNSELRRRVQDGDLPLSDFFGQLLRLIYRLIFLLAAEDRGLLHAPEASAAARALYGQGYSLSSLRDRAVRRTAWDSHHDKWEGLMVVFAALARGEELLGLPALGGLFGPDITPDLETAHLTNRALMEAIFRLAWLREEAGLVPVNWRDMETEELGSVYESLLELTPRLVEGGRSFAFAEGGEAKGHARKTTGSYYTPDSLVQALLDTALDPVLDRVEVESDDSATALLGVTVIDPACGSGHFLLAAGRRIATRLARARTGGVASAEDYRHALRDVTRACIHGVDRNPMAVELTKVALWIETVEPGKPLGFLDANIRCGDSLFGVFDLKALAKGIPDAAYKPLAGDDKETARHFAKRNKAEREGQGALDFAGGSGLLPAAAPMAGEAKALRAMPEDSPQEIAAKRKRFEAVQADPRRWNLRIASDLYVAALLTPKTGGVPVNRNTVTISTTAHIWDALAGRTVYGPLVGRAQDLAGEASAFHWPLEFPDVMAAGGFDVVLGNPPWERIKLQEQEFFAARDPEIAQAPNAATRGRLIAKLKEAVLGTRERALYEEFEAAKRAAEASSVFVRVEAEDGGRFPLTGRGDVNTYALFAELFASLASKRGRAGVIVPTGIATDATTAAFFAELIEDRRLAQLIDFENRERLFPAVDSRMKFCLLTIGRDEKQSGFGFFLTDTRQLAEPERRFTLSAEDIARINPNTKTAPVFRSRADAELTAKIYGRARPLIDLELGEEIGRKGNPWNVDVHSRFIHVSEDSARFRKLSDLAPIANLQDRWVFDVPVGKGNRHISAGRWLPLTEGEYGWIYDHRFATCEAETVRAVTTTEHNDPSFEPQPLFWVHEGFFEERLQRRIVQHRSHLLGCRRVSSNTNERTLVGTVLPFGPSTYGWILFFTEKARDSTILLSNLNSLVVDYSIRNKLSQPSIPQGTIYQLPILPPAFYTPAHLAFIVPRVLELTYTSHSMAPFARDLGYEDPPFKWDEDRRAQLRAELDAWYARAYGLTRDELRYILDPADVKGDAYPSETFRVLKTNETRRFSEYRTARLVLQAWDRMERGEIPEISPPITITAPATAPSVAPIDTTGLLDGTWATPAGGNVRDKTLAQIAAVLKALPGPTLIDLAYRAALYALAPHLLTSRLQGVDRDEWLRLVGPEGEPRQGVPTAGLGSTTGWGEAVRLLAATGCLVEDAAAQTWKAGTGLDAYFTDSWPQRAGFALQQAAKILADESAAVPTAEEKEGLTALAA